MDLCTFSSHKDFDVVKLQGELRTSALTALSPLLGDHLVKHPHRHLVLDFSSVTFIDGAIAKLFANIQTRLESGQRKMYLLHVPQPMAAILTSVNLNNAIGDLDELERTLSDDCNLALQPYVCGDEKGLQRLRFGCAVCGSRNVVGYLLDRNAYAWNWKEEELFPRCTDRAGNDFDFFAAQPIVCPDCFLAAIDPGYFNILETDFHIAHRSQLSEPTINHLSKNTHKRKAIFNECAGAPIETVFAHQRSNAASYCAHLLADATLRIIAVNKAEATPFQAGVVNYRALKYADATRKEELIDNCRTWISQAFTEKKMTMNDERAQAYFILFITALLRKKVKEANATLQDLSSMMETITPSQQGGSTLNSPDFWFARATELWQIEIRKKSSLLAKTIEEKMSVLP
jgi:anti-anti-sigma regulatory factor